MVVSRSKLPFPCSALAADTVRPGQGEVRAVELSTWAGMQSSCQQNLMRVMRCVGCAPLRFPGFPIPAVAASPPSGCVGITRFLTHPLLGSKATLKTNNMYILQLKDYCFTVRKQARVRGRTGTCLGSQSKTTSELGKNRSPVCPPRSPFLCIVGLGQPVVRGNTEVCLGQ